MNKNTICSSVPYVYTWNSTTLSERRSVVPVFRHFLTSLPLPSTSNQCKGSKSGILSVLFARDVEYSLSHIYRGTRFAESDFRHRFCLRPTPASCSDVYLAFPIRMRTLLRKVGQGADGERCERRKGGERSTSLPPHWTRVSSPALNH